MKREDLQVLVVFVILLLSIYESLLGCTVSRKHSSTGLYGNGTGKHNG